MTRQRVVQLSASIMCADLLHLADDVEALQEGGIDRLHLDVMDGNYVPNLGLSMDVITQLSTCARRPMDAHLMVYHPETYLDVLAAAGVDTVSVHPDTLGTGVFRWLAAIRERDMRVGIVVNPMMSIGEIETVLPAVDRVTVMTVDPGFAGQRFLPGMEDKVRVLADSRRENRWQYDIEVDGSINPETFPAVLGAGADVLVLGSTGLFNKKGDRATAVRQVRAEVNQLLLAGGLE